MREVAIKNNKKAISIPVKLLFLTGILFVVFGIILVLLSLRTEILDNKYKMTEVTEYIKKERIKLPEGQIYVSKETEYIERGIYKITYKNYANKSKKELLENGTYLTIKDLLGEGYILKGNIIINDKTYNLKDIKNYNNFGISLNYKDEIIKISIDNTKVTTENEITYYIKLIGRKTNYKYQTSKESYYNFIPSMDNNHYQKKLSQSYVIESNAYILLTDK